MLIGKTENGFFAVDSHSSSDGMCSVSGKSIRVLLQTVEEVFTYLNRLLLHFGTRKPLNVI